MRTEPLKTDMTAQGRAGAAGIRRGDLLPDPSLRLGQALGVIKRVAGTYRLTKAGRAAAVAAERLTEAIIIPAMI